MFSKYKVCNKVLGYTNIFISVVLTIMLIIWINYIIKLENNNIYRKGGYYENVL